MKNFSFINLTLLLVLSFISFQSADAQRTDQIFKPCQGANPSIKRAVVQINSDGSILCSRAPVKRFPA